jgi:hypothetical protein
MQIRRHSKISITLEIYTMVPDKAAPAAPLAERQRRALPWRPARRTPGPLPGTRQIGRTHSRTPDAFSWPLSPPSLSSSLAISRSLQSVAARSAPRPRSGIADLAAAY